MTRNNPDDRPRAPRGMRTRPPASSGILQYRDGRRVAVLGISNRVHARAYAGHWWLAGDFSRLGRGVRDVDPATGLTRWTYPVLP